MESGKLAFLGLGVMGFPMAGHLARAGHDVTVHNRSRAKSERWVAAHGGRMAETTEAAARDAEVVMACVGNDDDLRAVTTGPGGAFDAMAAVTEVLSKGAAQSWQMEQRAVTMAEGRFEFGFAVDWMRKDLAIALAEAGARGVDLPVARLVDGFYAEVQRMGGGRWDTSS